MSTAIAANSSHEAQLDQIATKLELPRAETNDLVHLIKKDILRSVYRYPSTTMENGKEVQVPLSPEELDLNRRCEALYAKWHDGQSFPNYRRKIRATGLFGPPGHGKTTSFEVAAREVAEGLGMRFLSPEQLEHVPMEHIDINTFVFVSQETAGVASALEFAGLPSSEEVAGTNQKYMGRLFTLPLLKLMKAGAGVLLLDDFLNAQRQIQDVGLSLTDRRRYGQLNLQQTYFGVTGNLGSMDDTNASRASSALRNRVRLFLAHDTVENFIQRIQAAKDFRDDLGDGFVRMYLHRYPQMFSEMPRKGTQGAYTTPRSLRDFIDEARDCLHRHGGRKNAARAREELFTIARATLGIEAANSYNAFLEAVLSKADPLAREIIQEGKMSTEEIRKSYSEGGFSAKEQGFAYQFALALVDYAVHKVIQDGKMDEAIKRFGEGIVILDGSVFSFAIEELQNKLAAQVDKVKGPDGKDLVVSSSTGATDKRRELTTQATETIGQLILSTGKVSQEQRSTMISVLSEMSKFETRVARPSPRTRKSNP